MKLKKLSVTASVLLACSSTMALAANTPNPLSKNLNTLVNTPVTSDSGYYPLRIVDNLKDSSNIADAYLLMVAKTYGSPANACVMHFSAGTVNKKIAAVGTCKVPGAGENIGSKAQSIKSLPGYDSSTHSVLLYIPNVQSGRAFISLNHKLSMTSIKTKSKAGDVISYQAPNDSNPNDPSYDIIYDKFEFSYDQTDTFWINPTSVDFYGIPISLVAYGTQPNAKGLIEQYSGSPLYKDGSTDTITRTEIINSIKPVLSNEGTDSPWNKLVHDYKGSTIRIDAPQISTDFPRDTYLVNFVKFLKSYYAQSDQYITINVSELAVNKKHANNFSNFYGYNAKGQPQYPPGSYPRLYEFTGHVNDSGEFVFSNKRGADEYGLQPYQPGGHNFSVDLNDEQAISKGFFEPGTAGTPFATPNTTLQSVIIKNLAGAWSVGMLPAYGDSYQQTAKANGAVSCNKYSPGKDLGVVLNTCYFEQHKDKFYTTNPEWPTGSNKPDHTWFDVYAQAIHTLMPNTYAYAYDDVVKQDGTISDNNNTHPVTVVLGDMTGVSIPTPPAPTQFSPATITNVKDGHGNNAALYCDGSDCTAKVSFTAPGQAGVSYYAMPNNKLTASAASIAKQQPLVPGTNSGSGDQNYQTTITVPQDDVSGAPAAGSTGTVTDLQTQVFSCSDVSGGNCPNETGYKTNPPTGSAIYPTPAITVLAPTITSHSGYTCSGSSADADCTVTVDWTTPKKQPSSAQYYIGLQGYNPGPAAGFQNNVYKLTDHNVTTQTITVSKSDINPKVLGAQVFACSNVNNSCPTSANGYTPENPAPGTPAVTLTKP